MNIFWRLFSGSTPISSRQNQQAQIPNSNINVKGLPRQVWNLVTIYYFSFILAFYYSFFSILAILVVLRNKAVNRGP